MGSSNLFRSFLPLKSSLLQLAPNALLASTLCWGQGVNAADSKPLDPKGTPGDVLKIGMSTVLTGPAAQLGLGMKTGIEAYFAHINSQGGVFGKKLELISKDDGYEPKTTAPNMRSLIDDDKVFAIIGNVGTPTAIVSVPIANETKTPFFGAFTGAGVLRKSPPERYIFNYRASYAQETAAMVHGFVKDLGIKPEEIAFFTQNDGYGDAGYTGGIAAIKELGYADADKNPHGRYTRNTTDVEDGLLKILEAKVKPKAIIMVGAYQPCAAFIKLAKAEKLNPIFANVSFVGSNALAAELGAAGDGVVVTQVVPFYEDNSYPAVVEYKKLVKPADQGFVSFEGFLAAKSFVVGLTKAGANPTKESYVDALESLKDVDLGLKTKHSLSKDNHQFSQAVWPTMIQGGTFKSFEWKDLKAASH